VVSDLVVGSYLASPATKRWPGWGVSPPPKVWDCSSFIDFDFLADCILGCRSTIGLLTKGGWIPWIHGARGKKVLSRLTLHLSRALSPLPFTTSLHRPLFGGGSSLIHVPHHFLLLLLLLFLLPPPSSPSQLPPLPQPIRAIRTRTSHAPGWSRRERVPAAVRVRRASRSGIGGTIPSPTIPASNMRQACQPVAIPSICDCGCAHVPIGICARVRIPDWCRRPHRVVIPSDRVRVGIDIEIRTRS
jgi:hypothetical protein